MDSYFRDQERSPQDRTWSGRDDGRKDDRDLFYRGRSPGPDRGRRNGRSRSPPPRDRYEPRSRVRDDYGSSRDRDRDDRRRIGSPPANIDRYVPGQSSHVPLPALPTIDPIGVPMSPATIHVQATLPSVTNPIPDPLKLPYQVGFSYFGEWWRANEKVKEEKERLKTGRRREPERLRGPKEIQEEREKEKAKIQVAYDAYKEEVQAKAAQSFVKQHKDEQWFRERYIPEIREPFRRQLCEFRKESYMQWEQDVDTGLFDEFTLEGIHKSDNAAGAVADREEGEATAGNDIMGVDDLVPASSAADMRDEILFRPTLLIKTIAPSVSRHNLEAFCRENLGEGEGGLRWLSLSDPNPNRRFHRIGWIMLNSGPEGGHPVEKIVEDGDVDVTSPTALSVIERAVEAVNGKTVKDEVRGDFICHVGVHNPSNNTRKKALWDLFSAPERIDKDLSLVQRLVAKFEAEADFNFNAIAKVEEKVDELKHAGRLQTLSIGSAESKAGDDSSSFKRKKKAKRSHEFAMDVAGDDFEIQADEDDNMEDEGEEDGAIYEEADDQELLVKKKQLDLLIEYLRRVYNFCFFCVFESDSVHELARKCPGGHLRRPGNTLTDMAREVARASAHGEPFPTKRRDDAVTDAEEGELPQEGGNEHKARGGAVTKSEQQLQRAFNWVRTFEEKIYQILEPESVDLRKFGGKPLETALTDDLAKYVKQEDEHKFRCKLPECTKLFKEEHFWRKHVEKRHTEWYDALKAELELVNAYASDPSHVTPPRVDSNGTGGPNSQVTGTPRGFNLHNYSMNNAMPSILGFPAPGSFGTFNPMGMPLPGSWPSPSATSNGSAGPGPIRRGTTGGRYSNRSGPYDRRPMRWNHETGLTGGPGYGSGGFGGARGGGSRNGGAGGVSMGASSRWSDGTGGPATMSPREAVQGRSIKSYEDLDQVPAAGGGELNY